jgi:hypothetical protein
VQELQDLSSEYKQLVGETMEELKQLQHMHLQIGQWLEKAFDLMIHPQVSVTSPHSMRTRNAMCVVIW